jgi:hypothetical protein
MFADFRVHGLNTMGEALLLLSLYLGVDLC